MGAVGGKGKGNCTAGTKLCVSKAKGVWVLWGGLARQIHRQVPAIIADRRFSM